MKKLFLFLGLLLQLSCITQKQQGYTPGLSWSLRAGASKGGIVENSTPDAFTGATRQGIHAGAGVKMDAGLLSLETGLDFASQGQTFHYHDPQAGWVGSRQLLTRQWMLPLTLNLAILRRHSPEGLLMLRGGYNLQYNMLQIKCQGVLPDYSTHPFSRGLLLGVETTPVCLGQNYRAGFYLEAYRGSRIFTDPFNPMDSEIPGSSFVRAGIVIRFSSR